MVLPAQSDYAARFSGLFRVVVPGAHTFILEVDDGARLTVDGTQVVEIVGMGDVISGQGMIDLPVGTSVIEIEFFQSVGDAEQRLSVISPGQVRVGIRGRDSFEYDLTKHDLTKHDLTKRTRTFNLGPTAANQAVTETRR